jgi:ParB-like chromosome segregation protein Spo0J
VVVPVSAIAGVDSPRTSGEDEAHIRLLSEVHGDLPPILVHRETMRVVDGMHRLRAAMRLGKASIRVRYLTGDADVAFLMAVRANTKHGLPLSLAEREAAASRILSAEPEWSDRAIAMITGLSARTVAAVRGRERAHIPTRDTRLGWDGRVRPLDPAAGRRRAIEMIARQPHASLREIATVAGISPATVRDVRERLRRGQDPIPDRQRTGGLTETYPRGGPPATPSIGERRTILENLTNDPSLRFTDSGRALLRWLHTRAAGADGWPDLADNVPSHCAHVIARLARSCADEWLDFAERMKRRARG